MSSKPRPKSAYDRPPRNEKWGTVAETNRGLGYQRGSRDEIDALVERLSGSAAKGSTPDSNRTGAAKEMGIMNSHAWKGY